MPKQLRGITEARLHPEPLRPLSRRTSYGYDVIDFAEAIGEPLLPWQQWAVKHAMEVNADGTYRFRIVLIMVARQSGKSHLMRMITLWRMLFDDDCRLILGTAQDLAQASNQWKLTLRMIEDTPSLARRLSYHRHVNGQEAFGLKNGAEYMVRSATPDAGRGFSVDGLIMDELRTHRDRKAWSALYYTTMARPNPLTICLSNAGDDTSTVLNQLRDSALSGRDESVGLFEWSGEDGCELDDTRAWRQANPGLGYTVSESAIRTACATETPEVFRTEVLCQKVDALDGAIDLARWEGCADLAGTLDGHRDRIGACFDAAPDGKHATLAVAARLDDGRARVEVAEAWDDINRALAELPGLLAKIRPAAFGWYSSGPAAGGATTLRALGMKYNRRPGGKREPGDLPEDGAITGSRVTEGCQEFSVLVKGSRVIHPDDPLLNAHVSASRKLNSGDGWRFVRKGEGHVDAAYAGAGAVKIALTIPPPKRPGVRMIVA